MKRRFLKFIQHIQPWKWPKLKKSHYTRILFQILLKSILHVYGNID